jgi:protein-export membrane protein SecD
MNRTLWEKVLLTLALTFGCLYYLIGLPTSWNDVLANLSRRVRLGLDLKGGTHLILQVQVQDAMKAEADQLISRLRPDLARQNIPVETIGRNDPKTIEEADSIEIQVKGIPTDRVGDFKSTVEQGFPDWLAEAVNSTDWRLRLRPSALARLKRDTVTQSIATIENRVNGLGLTEPDIRQHGRADAEYEILVQLPGVRDPAHVMQILQMTAQLQIKEVLDGPFPSYQAALAAHSGILPPNSEVLSFPERGAGGQFAEQYYILNRMPVVTGRDMRNARATRSTQNATWETAFVLSPEAGARFAQFTGANIGKRLSVVLDDRIKNVAEIKDRISEEGVIMGLSGEQEALDLALVLRAGSLPASVKFLEERTVGASLGSESIRQGVRSALLGLAIIAIVMVVYYRKAGINADVALLLNLLLLMAVLSYFDSTLTLPGIAGIILTIGMAVDANVLIFERIREELRAGKGVVGALNAGFGKAFLTIIDTNLTTIIAAAFLFLFGSGPVRGFAVTLAVGLIANLFTSVFVSRLIFDVGLARKQKVTELSI